MSGPTVSLREAVASALYNEPTKSPMDRIPWEKLPDDRKEAWLADADRVIPIVTHFCGYIAELRDPEKPANWQIRREDMGRAMRNLYPYNPAVLPRWDSGGTLDTTHRRSARSQEK